VPILRFVLDALRFQNQLTLSIGGLVTRAPLHTAGRTADSGAVIDYTVSSFRQYGAYGKYTRLPSQLPKLCRERRRTLRGRRLTLVSRVGVQPRLQAGKYIPVL